MTEADKRMTGREWFKENKGTDIDELTMEEEDANLVVESSDQMAKFEEEKLDDEEQEAEGALYDKNLFAEELEGDIDEDVDFD